MPPYRMDVTTDHYPIFFLLLSECIQQERLNKLNKIENTHVIRMIVIFVYKKKLQEVFRDNVMSKYEKHTNCMNWHNHFPYTEFFILLS